MNTSSKPVRGTVQSEVMEFPYEELGEASPGIAPGVPWGSQKDQRQRDEAARQAAVREGEGHAKTWFEAQIQELRNNLAAALETFADERRTYFLAAEREVVQLACSITRKILRRESSLDPLLLAGMVRVALEQISQATRVTVRVHPQQVSDFRVFFARHMQENPPEIVEDPTLEPDRCVLHTELGSTEIGPEIQLKEIEQGLLDLQAAKPHSNP
jgi:flagellar assembly protein FliH